MNSIKRIVVHHGGAAVTTCQNMARYHVNSKGWPGIGYHFVVDPDGRINYVGDMTLIRYHAADANNDSIGVCLNGNYMVEEPTEAALASFDRLVSILNEYLSTNLQVVGHRDVLAGTVCPGDRLYAKLFGAKTLAQPPKPSTESIRARAWNGVSIPYNPEHALPKLARLNNAGAPVTKEIDLGKWVMQGFSKCIILVEKGRWDECEVFSW